MELRPAHGPRLVLQLLPRDEGLAVEIADSPLGAGAAADIMLQRIDDVLRLVSQPTFHEDVGRGLFRALFPGELAALYRAAFTQAAVEGERLTIELRFDPALVRYAQYPWELLHDGTRFLLQSGAVNLARCLPFPEPPRPLVSPDPLELLVVSAHPTDQPPLVSEYEQLQVSFRDLIRDQKLDLAYLLPPTWDALMDWLLAGAPGVLHFEGYGAFTRTGLLVFEGADGQSDPVDAATIGSAFYSTGLRLAVLSACDSKTGGEPLSSVAASLIVAGIPAVVAMQQRLPGDIAAQFSRGFYQALLDGHDIESAVAAARRKLARTMYWHVPALFLRTGQTSPAGQAPFERRIDVAGPRSAPPGYPLRLWLWIRPLDAPLPAGDDLRRLGLEPGERASRAPSPEAGTVPAEPPHMLPGLVEVRLIAPGCEIHSAARCTLTVDADFDPPPIWFALTPRRAGPAELVFEVWQGGLVIATATFDLRVTPGVDGAPVAVICSYPDAPDVADAPEVPDALELADVPEPVSEPAAAHAESQDEQPVIRLEAASEALVDVPDEFDLGELGDYGRGRAPEQPDIRLARREPVLRQRTLTARPKLLALAAFLLVLIVIAAAAALVLLLGAG